MDTPQILRRPAEWCTASPVVPECPQLPEPADENSPKKSGPRILLLGQQESQASERPQLADERTRTKRQPGPALEAKYPHAANSSGALRDWLWHHLRPALPRCLTE